MEYIFIRSKRKTISIRITREATVEVRAPLWTAKSTVEKLLAERADWIEKHLAERTEKLAQREAFSLTFGSAVLYRGREYPVVAGAGKRAMFDANSFVLPNNFNSEQIKTTIIKLYKKLAKQFLTERTALFSSQMGLTPSGIKINSAKTRWGSCSGKSSINFSWRLVLAADDVIDYVVVHELAHIAELNHSPQFWAVVGGVLPDYRTRQGGLALLQNRLTQEDWD